MILTSASNKIVRASEIGTFLSRCQPLSTSRRLPPLRRDSPSYLSVKKSSRRYGREKFRDLGVVVSKYLALVKGRLHHVLPLTKRPRRWPTK